MDTKDLAAAELAWVMVREEVYKGDGAPIPELLRRLKALATAVQDSVAAAPSTASPVDDCLRGSLVRLGIVLPSARIEPADLAPMLAEMEKRAANGNAVQEIVARCDAALKDSASVLLGVSRELGALFVAGEGPVAISEGEGRRGGTDRTPAAAEEASHERFGVTVEHHRVDALAGGEADARGAAAGAAADGRAESGLIQAWSPSAEEMAKSARDLAAAVDKAGLKVEIDVPRLVEKFKGEKGGTSVKRPAMAFYHWACKELRGG